MLSEKNLFDAFDIENNDIEMDENLNRKVVSKISLVKDKRVEYSSARRIGKIAIAMCMVVVLAVGVGSRSSLVKDNTVSKVTQTGHNPFIIYVSANELLEEGNEEAEEYAVDYVSMRTGTPEYHVDVSVQFPIEVKGEDIKSITYTIKNGMFVIYEPIDEESFIIEGKEGEYDLQEGTITSLYSKEVSTKAYESFTVDYNRQTDKNHLFTIRRSTEQLTGEQAARNEKLNYSQKYIIGDEQPKAETTKEFLDLLFEECEIECKVNYNDGTSQAKNILLHNTIPGGYEWTVCQYFTIQ